MKFTDKRGQRVRIGRVQRCPANQRSHVFLEITQGRQEILELWMTPGIARRMGTALLAYAAKADKPAAQRTQRTTTQRRKA